MIILAIETSCDETSVSLAETGKNKECPNILSNVVSSQIKIHSKWGGVIPNLAAREHLKNIIPVFDEALGMSKKSIEDVDLFSVTQGPGLIPALLIGTNFAKTLSYIYKKPLLGIHHVEGHIAANFITAREQRQQEKRIQFPVLVLVVSGGHTQLILMQDHLQYQILGETRDDAAGEAFDKVGKLLELGYPGGPNVSARAENYTNKFSSIADKRLKAKLEEIEFPRPMIGSNDLNFSFSGLKTSVLYCYRDLIKLDESLVVQNIAFFKDAICYQFQNAVVDVLVSKTIKAAKKFNPKTVLLAGGVAANKLLQKRLRESIAKEYGSGRYYAPDLSFCGDNAAMIAAAASYRFGRMAKTKQADLKDNWKFLQADANMRLKNI